MAILKASNLNKPAADHYQLSDFEAQKQAYLQDIKKQAEGIILAAKSEADAIRNNAKNEAIKKAMKEGETLKVKAREEGLAEGMKKGETEARKAEEDRIKKETEPLLLAIKQLLESLDAQRDELLQAASKNLLQTSLHLAKKIIGVEASTNVGVLQVQLEKALSVLKAGMSFQVRVHPDFKQAAETYLPQLQNQLGRCESVEVIADDTVEAGGCRVICGEIEVDTRLQEQWKRLIDQIGVEP